jgi:hypothetical protein
VIVPTFLSPFLDGAGFRDHVAGGTRAREAIHHRDGAQARRLCTLSEIESIFHPHDLDRIEASPEIHVAAKLRDGHVSAGCLDANRRCRVPEPRTATSYPLPDAPKFPVGNIVIAS